MKKILTEGCRLPVKMWLEELEATALAQARNLANLPFAFRHIALMPDCHSGYGMPIGGVLATKDVIVPNAVGVDIGCGMCALKTSLKTLEIPQLKKILGGIREVVPVGFDHHPADQEEHWMPATAGLPGDGIVAQEYREALRQVGTLGGGNHFIEIQKGSDGYLWLMIHSGSRNIGLKVAAYYNEIARDLNRRWFSSVEQKQDLAFLPAGTREAADYIAEMQFCVDFALSNRKLMMQNILEVMHALISTPFETFDLINIAHNYAGFERHFDTEVIVHRKGATSAYEGAIGIIPGSQGTQSFIVRGKGNPESFMSCSHGAGRIMGRKQAQRELNLEEEKAKLDRQGIVHSVRGVSDLDEAPGAYKDIRKVMEYQADLVEILIELRPLAVIKG